VLLLSVFAARPNIWKKDEKQAKAGFHFLEE